MVHDSQYFAAVLRTDLASFIAKTFHSVNPGTPFLPNWHIDAIAEYLTAATKGDITRLIINMPPRSLKSLCVSVAWPAWLLGHDPGARIMAASYSQMLSVKHSLDCRLVLSSPWYRALFPSTILSHDQNEKSKFVTTKRGFRFATSVGGTATGEGGNFLIVDDPHSPLQAASDTVREQAIEWFHQTFASRLDDKQRGVIAIVMQRLHTDDLTGHLLSEMGHHWEHLCLPAIAEQKTIVQLNNTTYIREAGDILHPSRENAKLIARAKQELGSYAFAAQYQQTPIPQEGGMVKPHWIQRYRHTLLQEEGYFGVVVQSWDTAIKAGERSDYSVCTVWGVRPEGYYIVDVLRKRMEYPELKHQVIMTAKRWLPSAILMEDKASGQMLLQDMRRESLPMIGILPRQDKTTRFAAVTPLFEAGKIYFPHPSVDTPWLADLEAELLTFPSTRHDDQIDSISQFLHWVREREGGRQRMRGL